MPTADEFTVRLAERLGVDPPSQPTIDLILELAGVAAHASERTAAPVSCWLVARAGVDVEAALGLAQAVADDLDG